MADRLGHTSNDPRQVPLHRLTLSFTSEELEVAYPAQFWQSSQTFVRFSLLLATGLYLIFGLLDRQMVPESAGQILVIRLIVAALLVGAFLFTFRPSIAKHLQAIMVLVIVSTGMGVLAMIAIASPEGGYAYYAGLMLVVMFGQAMLRLRFIYATGATWAVIIAYEVLCMTVIHSPGEVILNNSFFLIAANILGMFTSYGIEFYMKTVFWQQRLLVGQQMALNVEHERKTRELEAARAMQLAMLPQRLPDHAHMDICASMTTATEVGGDYYDYIDGEDGVLTFVVADAAGHGAQAGALVAAMKMMFSNHAAKDTVTGFLRRASQHLRAMGIPQMFLAAAMGKIRDDTLEVVGAGLPPAIVYRVSTGTVEHHTLKGVPLGTYAEVEYVSSQIILAPGDVAVFMTDGFLESTSPGGEMLGQARADALVARSSEGRASEIVASLCAEALSWTEGKALDDDITFLAIRRKTAGEEGDNEAARL